MFYCILVESPPWSISPNNLEHASRVALRSWIIFMEFELAQPIRSGLITFLLLVRYISLWPWPLTLTLNVCSVLAVTV